MTPAEIEKRGRALVDEFVPAAAAVRKKFDEDFTALCKELEAKGLSNDRPTAAALEMVVAYLTQQATLNGLM